MDNNPSLEEIEITHPFQPLDDSKKKRNNKVKSFFLLLLNVILLVLFLLTLGFCTQIVVLHSMYTLFYVVGDSMYPTLNGDATRSDGAEHSGNWGNYDAWGAVDYYTIDFGYMLSHDFLDDLRRFDVVVTHYPDDSESSGSKIKRVVGLPGESLYFDESGDLYVRYPEADEYVLVSQDHLTLRNKEQTAFSQSIRYGNLSTNPVELGEGEYFVVGDNRTASSDSRNVGPIDAKYLEGKAILIAGTCRYDRDVYNHVHDPSINWLSLKPFWAMQYL